MPEALSIGVPYKLFFHLTPKKLKAFSKAVEIAEKRRDKEMYIQATYIYEALGTVMSNMFSKRNQRHEWRSKSYLEEYEERHAFERIDKIHQLREQHAHELDAARRNFMLWKQAEG